MNEIDYLMNLLDQSFDLSVSFLDTQGKVSYGKKHKGKVQETLLKQLFLENSTCLPLIKTTNYMENYIGIQIKEGNQIKGTLILGPSIYTEMTKEALTYLVGDSLKKQETLQAYYKGLPIYSLMKLIHIGMMAHYMIYRSPLTIEAVIEANLYKRTTVQFVREKFLEAFSIARQQACFVHSYENEQKLFDYLRRGDTKGLLKHISQMMEGEIGESINGQSLRANKNMVIAMSSLACREGIKANLPTEVAYYLCDIYIDLIEQATTLDSIQSLFVTMMCDYCDSIKETQKRQQSPLVQQCIDLIYKNLYEGITVEQIGGKLNFDLSYLSKVFKKEVGQSLNDFILQVKVEEAQRLLIYTKYSLIYITTLLHFHDQSHFTKLFKKRVGMTPKKYRDQEAKV